METIQFTVSYEDYSHPRAAELAAWPLDCWPADAVRQHTVTVRWNGLDDYDDYGMHPCELRVECTDADKWELGISLDDYATRVIQSWVAQGRAPLAMEGFKVLPCAARRSHER